jgi:site-specific DNA-methyltransferase (cytosine-N4-specific)
MDESRHDCWDFRDAHTRTLTNCFHRYPAMMVPQVIDQLLRQFGKPGMSLLDPFCGTGRALVAGRVAGMECIGLDVNPLAVLVAKSKLQDLDPAYLNDRFRQIIRRLAVRRGRRSLPHLVGLDADYWFAPSTVAVLADLLKAVQAIFSRDCAGKDFFYVALSETIRDSSWTRKTEFKMYRMPPAKMERFQPDPVALFAAKVTRNIAGMRAYISALAGRRPTTTVALGDARTLRADKLVAARLDQGIDLIVTSPPYGDSRTTVDYGNFSRLSLGWLATDTDFAQKWGLTEELVTGINHRCLGGRKFNRTPCAATSSTLATIVGSIAKLDERRAQDVTTFFDDLRICLTNMGGVLSPAGQLCLIVANRKVKGIEIPTNEILIELASNCGLAHSTTARRRITGKRLPTRINTNSALMDGTLTMTSEYIMVFRQAPKSLRAAA